MIKSIVSAALSLAFCAWILPLGAFIKPSQEKTACGGARAFHMCTMGMQAEKKADSDKITFTSASAAEKTNKPAASSGGNSFTQDSVSAGTSDKISRLAELDLILPKTLFLPGPAPVPKA